MGGLLAATTSLPVLLLTILLLNRLAISAENSFTPRGVPLSRASLYDPQKDFSCLDGSKLIPFSMVNDDYCDCPDGSDEPGTSACSRGAFYCHNAGHVSGYIPSSRVNDKICDCCDGSDESVSGASCSNTCDELGRAAREEFERQQQLFKEGHQKRVTMAEEGNSMRKEREEEKKKLEGERLKLEVIKNEKEKMKIEKETPEKEALDRYRAIEDEKQKKLQEEEDAKAASEAETHFDMLDSNGDGMLSKDEIKSRQTFDKNKDGEVDDEEAAFFLNMEEEMTREDFLSTGWSLAKPFFLLEQGMFKPPEEEPSEEIGGRPSSEGQDHPRELTDEEVQAQAEKEQSHEEGTADQEEHEDLYDDEGHEQSSTEAVHIEEDSKYDEETQQLIDTAEAARSEYNEAEKAVKEIERKLDELNEVMSLDFGEDERFSPLHGNCFDFEDREYTYTLCPFKSATQKPKSGGSEVSLGKWGQWHGPENDKYSHMMYDKGQSCWNGPNRSAKVSLKCGLENRLIAVSEPSRCEYEYEFTSPAACSPPIAHNHDEL